MEPNLYEKGRHSYSTSLKVNRISSDNLEASWSLRNFGIQIYISNNLMNWEWRNLRRMALTCGFGTWVCPWLIKVIREAAVKASAEWRYAAINPSSSNHLNTTAVMPRQIPWYSVHGHLIIEKVNVKLACKKKAFPSNWMYNLWSSVLLTFSYWEYRWMTYSANSRSYKF